MKREEADYMQDTSNKQTERIKVSELDIIVNMISEKPYYGIKYKEVGEDYYHIGYSSYNLDFVLEWKDKCFEVVSERKSVAGWIPVSERLPEESYGCLVTVMDCEPSTQTDFENILPYFVGYDGHGWNNADGEKIPFEVIAWMPLPEPYLESEKRMANRNTLHSNKLDAFRKWLIKTGWTIEEPKGIWEVLRAKKAGRKNPLIVYQKMNKEHLSVLDRDIDVIKRFLQEK